MVFRLAYFVVYSCTSTPESLHQQQGDKVRRTVTTKDRRHLLHDNILDQQRNALTHPKANPITISTYRNLTGCTDRTARKELAIFAEEGRLREMSVGGTRGYVKQ